MSIKVFDGEKIEPGDKVAYPSHNYGQPAVMRKATVKKITSFRDYKGSLKHVITVEIDRDSHPRGWSGTRTALHNLNTVVKL